MSHTLSQSRHPNFTQTVKEYISAYAENQSERRKPVENNIYIANRAIRGDTKALAYLLSHHFFVLAFN